MQNGRCAIGKGEEDGKKLKCTQGIDWAGKRTNFAGKEGRGIKPKATS